MKSFDSRFEHLGQKQLLRLEIVFWGKERMKTGFRQKHGHIDSIEKSQLVQLKNHQQNKVKKQKP